MDQRSPDCRDRLTRETVAQLCELPPFRGADVAEVVPLTRRGLTFGLRFADGRQVVVKRATPPAGGRPHGSVAHEATVLFRLHPLGLPVPRPLATLTSPDGTVLVTEDLPGGVSLAGRRESAGGSAPEWAGAVGRALAAVHTGVTPARLPNSDRARRLVRGWTVVGPREVSVHADGYAELLRHLRRTGLAHLLGGAAEAWTPGSLVHGDVRADGVLCGAHPEDPRAVQLLDWEAAGHGDPRWDMGCLIGDLLSSWLEGLDVEAGDRLEDWTATARLPFSAVRAEIRSATTQYASVRPVTPGDRRQWVRFAAFPLVARACAAALHSADLPSRSLACLQVADHLLRRPDESGELLLCP